jgi:hypothetical protein
MELHLGLGDRNDLMYTNLCVGESCYNKIAFLFGGVGSGDVFKLQHTKLRVRMMDACEEVVLAYEAERPFGLAGTGSPKEEALVVQMLEYLANTNIDAQYYLAGRYEFGIGVSSDLKKSRSLYRMAADRGDEHCLWCV